MAVTTRFSRQAVKNVHPWNRKPFCRSFVGWRISTPYAEHRRWLTATLAFLSPSSTNQVPLHPGCTQCSFQRFLMSLSRPVNPSAAMNSLPELSNADLASKILTNIQQRQTEEALQALEILRKRGMLPNRESLSKLIVQLSYRGSVSALLQAQKIIWDLEKVRRTDLLDHSSLSLLSIAYAEAHMTSYAYNTIKLMLRMGFFPSVGVWKQIMIKIGGGVSDKTSLAIDLFDEICRVFTGSNLLERHARVVQSLQLGMKDEAEANSRALRPVRLISELGLDSKPFLDLQRAALLKMKPDAQAFNAALFICANLGFVEKAEKFFRLMPMFDVCVDSSSFDSLARLYAKRGQVEMLKGLPHRMSEAGIHPQSSTLRSIVAGLLAGGQLFEAKHLVLNMGTTNCKPSVHDHKLMNQQMVGLCMSEAEEAPKLSNWNWFHSVQPDVSIYTDLVKALIKNEQLQDAAQILIHIQRSNSPSTGQSNVDQAAVIWGLVSMGLIDKAYSLLQFAALQGCPFQMASYNSILQGYCSTGQLTKAQAIVNEIKATFHDVNELSYTPIIAAHVRIGDTEAAFELLRQMISAGIPPSDIVYEPLLHAYAKERKAMSMLKVVEELSKVPHLKVSIVSWNLVIESLSKKNMVFEARKTLKKLIQSGAQPTGLTYLHLVKGYYANNKVAELLSLWPDIKSALEGKAGIEKVTMEKEMLDMLLLTFLKGAYFGRAQQVVTVFETNNIPVDKDAYRSMFLQLHAKRFTSKHKSRQRVDRRTEQLREMECFKAWLGLPHSKPLKKKR